MDEHKFNMHLSQRLNQFIDGLRIQGCAPVQLFALKGLQKIGQEMGARKCKVPFAQVEPAHCSCPGIDRTQPLPMPLDHFCDSDSMRFSPVDEDSLIEMK